MYVPKSRWLAVLEGYLNGTISAPELNRQVLDMWHHDRDHEEAIQNSWPRRYDLELFELREEKQISEEEFDRRYNELWGWSERDAAMEALVGSAFVSIDFWCDNDDGFSPGSVESERNLRAELAEITSKLRELLPHASPPPR